MNENFENNINGANGNNQEPVRPVEPQASQQQTNYSQPNNPYSGYYANSNQYMPYGNYYRAPKPETEKKPSKNKKKGLIIAVLIVCVCFLIGAGCLISRLAADKDNDSKNSGDKTEMNLVESNVNDGKNENTDGTLTAKQVYNKVHQSSVGILVYTSSQQNLYSQGSGIVMSTNEDKTSTYIVTCAHVIDAKNPKIIVQTADGTQYDGYVVGVDEKTDIGVVRVNSTDLQTAEFADSSSVEVGDTVYAIGNPGGTQFFGSFTNGMVSAIGRPVDSPVGYEVACIQHTAPINPGNSGGALVNEYGQVIGINSSKIASTEYEGMGFAVPSVTVKEVVDELIKNGRVTNRAVLGVMVAPNLSSQTYSIIVKSNKLPAGSSIIDTIMVGSDLPNQGVKEGDMIISVNGEDMTTQDVLTEAIKDKKVGDTITLGICRIDANYNVSTFEVKVKLVDDSTVYEEEEEEETGPNFYFPFGN